MLNTFTILNYLYKKQGSIGKAWQHIRRHIIKTGWSETKDMLIRSETLANFETWQLKQNKKIVVISTPHTIFINNLICHNLKNFNIPYESKIISDRNYNDYSNELYLIICPQYFNKLPKLYIAYQLEQTESNRWFDDIQIEKFKRSLMTLDYSLNNISFLSNKNISTSQLYFLPIDSRNIKTLIKNFDLSSPKKYDVIFYGDTNNERRQYYITELTKNFNVKVINNMFGENIWKEIQSAKIVVNIHYYEDASLETTTLYECLSNEALVISEKSSDLADHKDLLNLVDFVEENDVHAMIDRIKYWLENDEEYLKKKEKIRNYSNKEQNNFDFYLNRALLALDLISFEDFYVTTHKTLNPSSDFWCLGLPEYAYRRNIFTLQNEKIDHEIWKFQGVRHLVPWIGCGMSYKYIIKYAMDKKLEKISICEDDVIFSDKFNENYEDIVSYLKSNNDQWNIFSGHITDLHNDTRINKICELNDLKLIKLNKTTGMVFNIYNKNFFEYLIAWNEGNHDLKTNTIDRYIENHPNLKVISSSPYLVSHNEELQTTLWNRKMALDSDYSKMIKQSQSLINDHLKVD